MFTAGVGFYEPAPSVDVASYLSFVTVSSAHAQPPAEPAFLAVNAEPSSLIFVRHEMSEADDTTVRAPRDSAPGTSGGHGRFAAPGNAVRRQVQVRAISPRSANSLCSA